MDNSSLAPDDVPSVFIFSDVIKQAMASFAEAHTQYGSYGQPKFGGSCNRG